MSIDMNGEQLNEADCDEALRLFNSLLSEVAALVEKHWPAIQRVAIALRSLN